MRQIRRNSLLKYFSALFGWNSLHSNLFSLKMNVFFSNLPYMIQFQVFGFVLD